MINVSGDGAKYSNVIMTQYMPALKHHTALHNYVQLSMKNEIKLFKYIHSCTSPSPQS
jgi:hypothetical protein